MPAVPEIEIFGVMTPELLEFSDEFRCTFLGHSFISRLKRWLESPRNPFGRKLAIDSVSANFVVGYTIPQLFREAQKLSDLIAASNAIIIDMVETI